MKIVSIQGGKSSGKTTTAVKLIKHLKSAGYKVAYLKISPTISLDKKNSDTGRAKQAGAKSIIAQDQLQTYISYDKKINLCNLFSTLTDDFLIGENLKKNYNYKIFCANKEDELDLADLTATDCICGKYSNYYKKYKQLPVYNANTEIEKIVNLFEK